MSPEADFMQQLEEELESCQLSEITLEDATTDEIVRDLHRMIMGNGGPTRGLIVKVAAANVNIKGLQTRTGVIEKDVKAQKKTCAEFRHGAELKAAENEGKAAKKIVKVLWDNRVLFGLLVVGGLLYYSSNLFAGLRVEKLESQLNSAFEKKLEKLLDLKLNTAGAANARDDNSRADTR